MNKNKLVNIVFALLIMSSCAMETPEGKTQAEVLFKEAKILKDDGRFIMATEKLNRLKNEHPYSFFAVPSELLLADILFEQENYIESAAAYIIFKDFHPRNAKVPYVVFRIAESFYKQIPDTPDRYLESAHESIKYYRELLNHYPKSEYIKDAAKRIKKAQGMIIQKEKDIADFYYRTEVYDAAMWRYKNILENIKEINVVRHSMLRLIQSSFYSNKFKECLHYAKNFIPLFKGDRVEEAKKYQGRCVEFLKKDLKNE